VKPLVAIGAVAAAAWAGWIEPRRLVTRHHTLHLPRWPTRLDGLRLGVLSDLHAGVPHAGRAAIVRAVERINHEQPDAALLLGDFLDATFWGGRLAPEIVARELAALNAPLGTFAVLGNHDWRRAGDGMWRALVAEGITVLENSADRAGELYVTGLADLRSRRPDLPGALSQVPPDSPVILLAHDPDVFPYVPDRVALTLSGHTHGGQIAIPRLRSLAIPSRYGERYARGHIVEQGRHLFVSSGLGTSGLPLRALVPPEVVVLTLVREQAFEGEDPAQDRQ
jgi:predicted MPP superfamily phosphohydrolase